MANRDNEHAPPSVQHSRRRCRLGAATGLSVMRDPGITGDIIGEARETQEITRVRARDKMLSLSRESRIVPYSYQTVSRQRGRWSQIQAGSQGSNPGEPFSKNTASRTFVTRAFRDMLSLDRHSFIRFTRDARVRHVACLTSNITLAYRSARGESRSSVTVVLLEFKYIDRSINEPEKHLQRLLRRLAAFDLSRFSIA